MVRNCRLIEIEAGGEVADADLVFAPRKRREDRQARRVGERFEEDGLIGQILIVDHGLRAAALYRHASILCL